MSIKRNSLLQNPEGTESFQLVEAYRHRQNVRNIEDIFLSWGYLPVQTPVLDYYEIYQNFINETSGEENYRLIGRNGELLILRSDITLFLAKQMGMCLTQADLPVRVFYADSILRYQDSNDISKNEFFQIGAELIGKEGLNADLEALSLLCSSLQNFNTNFFLHIGSKKLFNILFSDFSDEVRREIENCIKNRSYNTLSGYLLEKNDLEKTEIIISIFKFIGNSIDFSNFILQTSKHLCKEAAAEMNYLLLIAQQMENVISTMKDSNVNPEIRIDLSEIGGKEYYTGLVFSVYMNNADSSVAAGGRYDKLLKNFGFSAPSIGFSIQIRKIEQKLPLIELEAEAVTLEEQDFISALKKAEELRKKGRIVLL